MWRVVKIICLVLAALMLSRFLGFVVIASKVTFDAMGSQTTMQLLASAGFVVAAWAGLIWTIYLGWRTIRTWDNPSCVSALLTVLPTVLVPALALVANAPLRHRTGVAPYVGA